MTSRFDRGNNPFSGNPFANRSDAQRAVRDLVTPLLNCFSLGCARVIPGVEQAQYDTTAAHLEGLARPLWGLAPLIAGGGSFNGIAKFLTGLSNGPDPSHPEFWGHATDCDQRLVESGAIGYALLLAPEVFWDGLTPRGRDCLRDWLLHSLSRTPVANNWNFFQVLVSMGLTRVGVAHDLNRIAANLDLLESFDLGRGWYRDGDRRRADHYIPFAMHFYGLLYAKYGPEGDLERRNRFRARVRDFAPQIAHWYASNGAALPFGRSMTYRFAAAGFWGMLGLAGEEALPAGDVRGLWARNLRWWSRQPICDRSGVLTIGYSYPQPGMSEEYNSPGSPYWALKAFAPLALPDTDPFWTTSENPPQARPEIVTLKEPGMVKFEDRGDVYVLSGGQEAHWCARGAEKYNKFAYSTRYAFSVEPDAHPFQRGTFDNMLAFSENDLNAMYRTDEQMARIGDGWLYSEWSPLPGLSVRTWLIARPPWHLRIHAVQTARVVNTVEGGFAIPRTDPTNAQPPLIEVGHEDGPAFARITTATDFSTVFDSPIPVAPDAKRSARVHQAAPNTNLMAPQTWVPQLCGTLSPGHWWLGTLVCAGARSDDAPAPRPTPDAGSITLADLETMAIGGQLIGVWNLPL